MALNPVAATGSPKISNILDLPDEILKEICSHCHQCDWICLALVCKRFRDLASAHLYRNFHIVFPDEDDPYFDSPIDGLAGGLSTFVTGEYDYAKHLREISLDTLSVGDRAEAAYKPYLATVSCGKFMNTLLLLTLRKARSLDTFRWNIRVELSRPVYKALHSIKSLRRLHLRLQAGPSLFETPPPLPYTGPQSLEYTGTTSGIQWPNSSTSTFDSAPSLWPSLTPSSPALKPSWKNRTPKKSDSSKEPPTISGFKNLESLSVLDIDNLDIIPEIKACVRQSSSTLRKLRLSFSNSLAMQSRKPSADAELDESEDDEFHVVPLSMNANYDNNGPAKAFRAQEERKAQESVLARILEVESHQSKNNRISSEDKKEEDAQEKPPLPEGQRFIDDVTKVFRRLAVQVHGTSDLTYLDQQDALDTITKAAKKYVASEEAKAKSDSSTQNQPTNDIPNPSSEAEPSPASGKNTDETQPHDGGKGRPPKPKNSTYDVDPDDIDIAAPEEQLGVEFQQTIDTITTSTDTAQSGEQVSFAEASTFYFYPIISNTTVGFHTASYICHIIDQITRVANTIIKTITKEKKDVNDLGEESAQSNNVDVQHGQKATTTESDNAEDHRVTIADPRETLRGDANKYARDTRGIGLHSLSIHLIPIKASVLGKAIDLHTLKRVVLLNVGEQKKFWALLMRENKISPLPLRKVFTDDASLQFLQLVSELSCVTEVFMLQRSTKYKPESFAPNPGTTIEQIRKFVLKKHLHSLKRLMIKNQADSTWDVDEKTIQLICRKGKPLEELAVIMGMRAIHTFIQYLPGLVNLRALQLVSFRTEDTCLSVMRETRRFIVDAISNHPELKLEWLTLGDEERAVRIVRKVEASKKSKNSVAKNKEPAPNPNTTYSMAGSFPAMPPDWDPPSESESDDGDGFEPAQKLELIEGFQFYDIYGIRIFKKEVASGRL
ncbi:hypothetical protein M426DRAFT_262879 [Hypoxylon sp. CI-4A]|nr:hypothetical protein M426DRAFT_262879 [Hypoxylon sp. CI-4A]